MQDIELTINDLKGRPVLRINGITLSPTAILGDTLEMYANLNYTTADWRVVTTVFITPLVVMDWLQNLEAFNSHLAPECLLQEPSKHLRISMEEEEGIVRASGTFSSRDYLAELDFQFETSQDQLRGTIEQIQSALARFKELERQSNINFN